ncbi:MAG: S8 family serine peptidase [Phycisphaerales bacterium]|nr:MAG: S8 family serine peptidase [Phycisphaerales bacterium]
MSIEAKISPAFEPFMMDSKRTDKREAIVIYRQEGSEPLSPHRRIRQLKRRLDHVKESAAAQRTVQQKLRSGYQSALKSKSKDFDVLPIGANTLPVASVEVSKQTLPALAEQPEVVAILPNQRVSLIEPKSVDYADLAKAEGQDGMTWGLKRLRIPQMWETTKGNGVRVAVLDTGVHGEHPALIHRVRDFVVIDPLGRRVQSTPSFDSGEHGTHVCGTIAGQKTPSGVSIGVAPEAELYVGAVLLGSATLRSVVEGISWAIEKGVDIVSLSLGFSYYEPLFAEVFEILINQYDVLPVVAIGNENHGNSSSPGNARTALAVGAVEKTRGNKVEVAFFSSGASLVFYAADGSESIITKPDVVAPGAQVFSCIPPQKTPSGYYEYTYMDGTSMAAPHVAGVAALLMAARPQASITEIAEALKETAIHPDGHNFRPDNRWGNGIINPVEALNAL